MVEILEHDGKSLKAAAEPLLGDADL